MDEEKTCAHCKRPIPDSSKVALCANCTSNGVKVSGEVAAGGLAILTLGKIGLRQKEAIINILKPVTPHVARIASAVGRLHL